MQFLSSLVCFPCERKNTLELKLLMFTTPWHYRTPILKAHEIINVILCRVSFDNICSGEPHFKLRYTVRRLVTKKLAEIITQVLVGNVCDNIVLTGMAYWEANNFILYKEDLRVKVFFFSLFFTYTLICLMAPYFPNISYISSAVILYGRFLMYRILFTSGGRRTWKRYSEIHNYFSAIHVCFPRWMLKPLAVKRKKSIKDSAWLGISSNNLCRNSLDGCYPTI